MQLHSHLPLQVFHRTGPGDFEPIGRTPGAVEVPDAWDDDWFVFSEEPLGEALAVELERLEVRGLALRGEDQLAWLPRFPELTLLKVLDRPESRLSDAGLARVAELRELRSLLVYGYGAFGDEGVGALALCTGLRQLHLQSAGGLTGAGLARALEYVDLGALTLGHARALDDMGLRQAAPAVPWLRLEGCPRIDGTGLASVTRLRFLELDGCGLTDVGLVHLCSSLPQLQRLTLRWCDDLTDDALTRLARLTDLRTLEVQGCPLGERALAALASHPTLCRLALADCDGVTDTALGALAGLRLGSLELADCKHVTAAGVRRLLESSRPEEVRITRCPRVDLRQLGLTGP